MAGDKNTSLDLSGTLNVTGDQDSFMSRFSRYKSEAACLKALGSRAIRTDGPYCRAVWDTVLCWPAAKADSTVYLPCPPLGGLVEGNKAYRYCGPNGLWGGRIKGQFVNGTGYTHYRNCYTTEAYEYFLRYMSNKTSEERELIKDIINSSRTLELVGLCISLVTTIISLVIFCYFRSLKCHRTRIHKNLFVAMIVQISMRIILYVDQLVARETGGQIAGAPSGDSNTIYDTPIFCEILYSLLEYTKTVKFMWMFIEGIYLHNMIAVSVFSGKPNYAVFYAIGWGFPVSLTIAWVIPMARMYETKCWFGYYNNPLIWIIEGPRTAVMAVNLIFLLNIIRVLVMKLRESQTNESNKLRKAVKAAIVLLPLLGLTNFVIMLEPDGGDPVKFSVYSFSSSFLNACEGFFISLLYCFLNGEVQSALRRLVVRHTANYATDISAAAWRVNTTKKNNPSIANGEASNGAMGMTNTRFSSIFKGRYNRRQSNRDLNSAGPRSSTDVPDLPDIVTCRTDLMCEENI